MINLTPQERDRFAQWLEEDAASDERMIEQLKILGEPVLIQKFKLESSAARIIASKLRSIQDETI